MKGVLWQIIDPPMQVFRACQSRLHNYYVVTFPTRHQNHTKSISILGSSTYKCSREIDMSFQIALIQHFFLLKGDITPVF